MTPALGNWLLWISMLKQFALLCIFSIAITSYGRDSKKRSIIIPDIELEMIRVDSGSYTLGSPPEEALRDKAEGPQTKVAITRRFWLGKTEVTQRQYEAIAGSNPSGPIRGHFRIGRGGSWRMDSRVGRSAARAGGSQGRRDYTIGFRVALSSAKP